MSDSFKLYSIQIQKTLSLKCSCQKIFYFGSPAIVPVCYGYIGGAMVEAFFTKGTAPELSKRSDEEE